MKIREWPAAERPREKFVSSGPESLTEAELLALFIRTGSRGRTAVDIARELLGRFGGLRAMLAAPISELSSVHGLGVSKCVQILAARELGVRCLEERLARGRALESPRDAADFLTMKLRDLAVEVFGCVFLDTRHQVIAYENLFEGTINGASVHIREVVRRVLHHNAAAIIVAHNHPSGVAEPSGADISVTRRLKDGLALVDVRLLDHLVIGNGECVSLSERGLV
ncbi:MAG: JAB domain-containing protein [Proteobacteria bacterium]|nr:MAG: JAB domain-containing protein [Pseudomonadota bacterium]